MVGGGVDPLPILLRRRRSLTPFNWGFSQVLSFEWSVAIGRSGLVRKSDRTAASGYSGLILPRHADGVLGRGVLSRPEYRPPFPLGPFPSHD